jgi:D-sedoheptulose 7-phosphate isomerase
LALEAARETNLPSIAFLGSDGGKAKSAAVCALIVPHRDSARVQEGHQWSIANRPQGATPPYNRINNLA